MTAGYEKFVLDCDMLGSMIRLLSGLDISNESLALQAIREVEPGGHFLGSDHTMRNFRSAFYRSDLMDYCDYEQWKKSGGLDTVERANQRVEMLLDEYEMPVLDDGRREALEDYIHQRKRDLNQ
jgi:trimethylamine--corrinoid protein Co-methyltransferase